MDIKNNLTQTLSFCVKENEQSFTDMFSSSEEFESSGKNVIRYFNEDVKGKYDDNYSSLEEDVDKNVMYHLFSIKNFHNEEHLKISLGVESEYLKDNPRFEKSIILTMAKEDYENFDVKEADGIKFTNLEDEPEYINQLIDIEVKYYAARYGEDFIRCNWNNMFRYVQDEGYGFNMFAALRGDKVVGYCYSYYDYGVVGIDALFVIEEERHKYIASNMLKHIASFYDAPIYLHADEEETSKDMYLKLGFVAIEKRFEYLYLDQKELVIENKNIIGHHEYANNNEVRVVKFTSPVEIINQEGFGYCHHLRIVDIPDGIKRIESMAFLGTKAVIFVPKSIEYIGRDAFGSDNVVFIEKGQDEFASFYDEESYESYPDSYYRGPSMGLDTRIIRFYCDGCKVFYNATHEQFEEYLKKENIK